ncbi:hypothetical protein QT238_13490 [Geobacillus stearothermophilus]|nr:hypothetical protein QT238_13490 [Geobacillus stearothermophilus]
MRGAVCQPLSQRASEKIRTPEAAFFFFAMNGQLPFANEWNVAKQRR